MANVVRDTTKLLTVRFLQQTVLLRITVLQPFTSLAAPTRAQDPPKVNVPALAKTRPKSKVFSFTKSGFLAFYVTCA